MLVQSREIYVLDFDLATERVGTFLIGELWPHTTETHYLEELGPFVVTDHKVGTLHTSLDFVTLKWSWRPP